MIPYSVNLIGNPRDPSQPKKAYARVQINKVYDVHEFAQYISGFNSKYDHGDIFAVLELVSKHLQRLLQNGNKVSLGSLGAFYPSISSDCTNSVGEFTNNHIRGVHTVWEAPKKLADMMQGATFRQVATRSMNAKLMKLQNSNEEATHEELLDEVRKMMQADKENIQKDSEAKPATETKE